MLDGIHTLERDREENMYIISALLDSIQTVERDRKVRKENRFGDSFL